MRVAARRCVLLPLWPSLRRSPLALRHAQPFLPPETRDALAIDSHALLAQLRCGHQVTSGVDARW